ITQNGYGKRTDLAEYSLQGRAGKGVKVGILNDKTGNVVNLKLVHPTTDDVMIVADNGIIIRIKADEISKIGRNTQGVKVMRMKDDIAKVVAFTVVPHDDTEEAAIDEALRNLAPTRTANSIANDNVSLDFDDTPESNEDNED
ncbi:MAG: DNA gyrase C-terminal beta-propeller domain-containing protein, partial [Clostridia bacterium]